MAHLNKRDPFFAVIVPTYNRSAWLLRCLESIRKQTFKNFEWIVVDDGSNDSSSELLWDYARKASVKVITKANAGVSAARNDGVKESHAPWITFLDSDDQWHPKKLEKQKAFIEGEGASLSWHQTEEIWIRNGVRVNPPKHSIKIAGDIFEKSLERCMITPSSVAIRRDFFDKYGGFDESLSCCEDYDLWLKMLLDKPIGLLKEPLLTRFGGHEDQLSASEAPDRFRIRALDRLLKNDLVQKKLSSQKKQAALAVLKKKLQVFGKGCLKRGKQAELEWVHSIAKEWGFLI